MNGVERKDTIETFELSLVRGDILYRLQRRIGLIPPDGPGIGRRSLFWALFAWLPIALWAFYTGRALPPAAPEPLLAHFGIHVRFLVAVPLFILAEGMAHGLTMQLLPYFVQSGVVPEREVPRFRDVIAKIVKLRDTAIPWIAILAFVVAALTVTDVVREPHEIAWAIEGDGPARHMGFGALWFLYVGRPIYLMLLFGWVWRVILMILLFRGIAGLDLVIVPTHPDRAGGLGFLERIPKAFAPVALAAGAVLAAGWAHDVVYHGASAQSMQLPMVAFIVSALLVCRPPPQGKKTGAARLRRADRPPRKACARALDRGQGGEGRRDPQRARAGPRRRHDVALRSGKTYADRAAGQGVDCADPAGGRHPDDRGVCDTGAREGHPEDAHEGADLILRRH
jgi:hypothetical protein